MVSGAERTIFPVSTVEIVYSPSRSMLSIFLVSVLDMSAELSSVSSSQFWLIDSGDDR